MTAVHPHPYITRSLCAFKDLLVPAFFPPDDGSQNLQFRSRFQLQDLIRHLIHALSSNLSPAVRARGNADPRIDKTKMIVDFRHRTHGGSGVAIGCFLVDRDGRRQSLDVLHVGLFHLSQKHSGIGGKRFHISALSLGKNRIEGEGGLAGTGKTG